MANHYEEYLKYRMVELSNVVFNCSQMDDDKRTKDIILDKLVEMLENYNRITGESINISDYRKGGC